MDSQPLKITAQLASDIAVFDDWSPALDSLLEWLLLDQMGLISPNPTLDQVKQSQEIADAHLPLGRGEINGEWYWQVSSPCYLYQFEQQSRFRKRWSPGMDSPEPNWGKRKSKWNTSEGAEKSYDLPLYLRSTPSISWYAMGDLEGIQALLSGCPGLGKKRSQGCGQVLCWEVIPHAEDWHLWRDGALMRPIPAALMPSDRPVDCTLLDWGWRPPAWLHSNKVRCAMPVHTVVKGVRQ